LLSESKATQLAGTQDATQPFFSPDGQWIGFFAEGKLKKISVQGGPPVTLANAANPRGGVWASDGTIIATLSTSGLFRIPEAGGSPQLLTKPADTREFAHRWPHALPGGQAVLFTASAGSGDFDDAHIDALSWKTGQRKTVLRGGYFGRYLPAGYLVYMHQGALFGVGFDLARLEIRGTPARLLEDVSINPTAGSAQFDFSRTGALVYLSGNAALQNRSLAWLDGAGRLQVLPAPPGPYFAPRLSPDGTRVALQKGTAPGDLWVYDWRRDTMSRLTFTARHSSYSVSTPDGKPHRLLVPWRHLLGARRRGWRSAEGAGK